jgi:hypothetical protein
MALYARDVLTGQLPGPFGFSAQTARALARAPGPGRVQPAGVQKIGALARAAAAARAAGRAELPGLVPTLQAPLKRAATGECGDELDADAGSDGRSDQR